jgi:hypothetical protein
MKAKYSTHLVLLLFMLLSSCGIYQRKYTHGHYFQGRQVVISSVEKKIEKQKPSENENESEKHCQSQNVKERWDTIVPLPLPVEKKDSAIAFPPEQMNKVDEDEYAPYMDVPKQSQIDEEYINKQIEKTYKAGYWTMGIPFIGWGLLRLALINGSFYTLDSTFFLILFTLAMLLAMAYLVTFILSLIWGFETQGKIEKYFKNHSLYHHWKERSSWGIILGFLGLLSPIISFILFLVSFGV